ncbi:hypothetical protein NUW58_g6458 [Xylaria curta]|uniref:Uncharacterized protein n=1 Tax=Xylaria curta TaxID=42375 RepID=A0ACC1NVI8_9PEZI|nr:hypothetical protein NUW58_g6458 [Xylaria curta]
MSKALDKLEALGVRVARDVPLNSIDEYEQECGIMRAPLTCSYINTVSRSASDNLLKLSNAVHQCRPTLEKYLSLFHCSTLQTLDDLIQFNEDHAAEELPPGKSNQNFLKAAQADTMTDEECQSRVEKYCAGMRNKIKKCLEDRNVDFIMAPGDSLLCTIAMAAGYPTASVPLGFADFNGRPFGIQLMGRDSEESSMLKLMAAWESAFPNATQPPFL